MVARHEVVQGVLDLFPYSRYLEIGVDAGETFRSLRAARKVAVDPAFKFTLPPTDVPSTVAYHPVTSDAYFGTVNRLTTQFDVVYIDGLHTFEQVLRDLLNASHLLSPNGVIVVDDVLPNSYHASLPNLADAFAVRDHLARSRPELVGDATWMGDVYKLVFFIRAFMQHFSYATVFENHGQLVVWRNPRKPENVGADRISDIGGLDFSATVLQRAAFNVMSYSAIIENLRQARGNWCNPVPQ